MQTVQSRGRDIPVVNRRRIIGLKAEADKLFKNPSTSASSPSLLVESLRVVWEASGYIEDFKIWLKDMIAAGSALPPDELISKVVTVTPEAAQFILDTHNTNNRSLKHAKIKRFAATMSAGRWRVTSQGMSFSRDGILNNGQNRLHGIVLAGIPVKVSLVFGEERAAFAVLDSEMTVRGTADTAHILGYKNTTSLSAAARVVANVELGNVAGSIRLQNSEVGEIIEAHPGLEDATTLGQRLAGKLKAPSSGMTAAIYYITRDAEKPHLVSSFVEHLCNPDGLRHGDPIMWLRDGFKDKQLDVGIRSNFVRSVAQAAAMINTWNLWIRGKNSKRGMMAKIVWSPADPFPVAE